MHAFVAEIVRQIIETMLFRIHSHAVIQILFAFGAGKLIESDQMTMASRAGHCVELSTTSRQRLSIS
jgi:hypothetical protein